MNNKKDLSLDDLKDLLLDNEITNFDPVAEAYRVFDTQGEGVLSGEKLRQAFVAYGMGELADEELDILIRVSTICAVQQSVCAVVQSCVVLLEPAPFV